MRNKLIKKCQYGTPRGGLVPHQESGSWGDRGQGNELQSALENGLTGVWNGVKWLGDKVFNAGDYIENGLIHLVGFIPGGVYTTEEMLENKRLAKEAGEGGNYYDVHGNLQMNPIMLKAPVLPTLPTNATPAMQALFNDLKRQRFNWQVRESQLRKIGKADTMESTGTAKVYRSLESELNKLIDSAKGHLNKTDDVKLSKKQNAQYKHSKYMASESQGKVGDLRTVNSGRPALKGRQWDEVERVLRTDSNPKAKTLVEHYDKKVAKGISKEALKVARQKMLEQYLDMMPGYFNYLRQ